MNDSDWEVPGSAPPSVVRHQAAAATTWRDSKTTSRGAVSRPVTMRPQRLIDVLDGGFAVIRSRPGLILGISAVFVMPLAVLSGYLQRDLLDGESIFDVVGDPSVYAANDTGWGATIVSLVGGSIVHTLVAAGIARVLTLWYGDTVVELGEILGWILRRSPVILLAWLLAHALQVLGLVALLIGMPIVATFTLVVAPVLGVEGGGPINALRRSYTLVRTRFGTCLVFFFVSGILGSIVAMSLSALPTGIGFVIGLDGGWIAVAIGEMAGGTVATAFVGAATAALYLDLRVRTEGLDLELALADAFPTDGVARR